MAIFRQTRTSVPSITPTPTFDAPMTPSVPASTIIQVSLNPATLVGQNINEMDARVIGLPVLHEKPEDAFAELAQWVAEEERSYHGLAAAEVRRQLDDASRFLAERGPAAALKANEDVRQTITDVLGERADDRVVKLALLAEQRAKLRQYRIRMTGSPEEVVVVPDKGRKLEEGAVTTAVFISTNAIELLLNYQILQGPLGFWGSVAVSLGLSVVGSFATHKAAELRSLESAHREAEKRWVKYFDTPQRKKLDPETNEPALPVDGLADDTGWKRKLAEKTAMGIGLVAVGARVASIANSYDPNWGALGGVAIFLAVLVGYYLYKVTRVNRHRKDMMDGYAELEAGVTKTQAEVKLLESSLADVVKPVPATEAIAPKDRKGVKAEPKPEDAYAKRVGEAIGHYEATIAELTATEKAGAREAKERRSSYERQVRELRESPEFFHRGYLHLSERLNEEFDEETELDLTDPSVTRTIEDFFKARRSPIPADLVQELIDAATPAKAQPPIETIRIPSGGFLQIIEGTWKTEKAAAEQRAATALEEKRKKDLALKEEEAKRTRATAREKAAAGVVDFRERKAVPAWSTNRK